MIKMEEKKAEKPKPHEESTDRRCLRSRRGSYMTSHIALSDHVASIASEAKAQSIRIDRCKEPMLKRMCPEC